MHSFSSQGWRGRSYPEEAVLRTKAKHEWAGSKVWAGFKPLLASCWLIGQKATWPAPKSRGKEIHSTVLLKKLPSYMVKGMNIRRDKELELIIQLTPENIFSRLQLSIQGTRKWVLFEWHAHLWTNLWNGNRNSMASLSDPVSHASYGGSINSRAMRHHNWQLPRTMWNTEGILQRKEKAYVTACLAGNSQSCHCPL